MAAVAFVINGTLAKAGGRSLPLCHAAAARAGWTPEFHVTGKAEAGVAAARDAAADGADLFVCECNFYDLRAPGHLNYLTLAEKRPQINCDRIVLTHMSERMLAHLAEVEFEAASDGAVISL